MGVYAERVTCVHWVSIKQGYLLTGCVSFAVILGSAWPVANVIWCSNMMGLQEIPHQEVKPKILYVHKYVPTQMMYSLHWRGSKWCRWWHWMMMRWVPRKQRRGACQCVVYGNILKMKTGYTEGLGCLRFNGTDMAVYFRPRSIAGTY